MAKEETSEECATRYKLSINETDKNQLSQTFWVDVSYDKEQGLITLADYIGDENSEEKTDLKIAKKVLRLAHDAHKAVSLCRYTGCFFRHHNNFAQNAQT